MKAKTKFVLALLLPMSFSGAAAAQYVIGDTEYTCPIGAPWNDPRCIRQPVEQDDNSAEADVQAQPVPTGEWVKTWGAIAADGQKGILGAVVGKGTRTEAEDSALSACREKGGSCGKAVAYFNQCAVLVTGKKSFVIQNAETIGEATAIGMKTCNKDDSDCKTYYSECSKPEYVRY